MYGTVGGISDRCGERLSPKFVSRLRVLRYRISIKKSRKGVEIGRSHVACANELKITDTKTDCCAGDVTSHGL